MIEQDNESRQSGSMAIVVTIANVLMAIVLIVGIYFDNKSVTVAVLSGAGYFALGTGLLVLCQPGALPFILVNRQNQVTLRRRDELPYLYMPQEQPQRRVSLVDPPRIGNDAPSLSAPSYVPAIARAKDELKVAAAGWVSQLFDGETGRPLPNRITRAKGNVQLKSPEEEITAYLCSLGIISQDAGKRLYYNTALFPTLREAINTIRTGVRPSPTDGGVDGWGGGS